MFRIFCIWEFTETKIMLRFHSHLRRMRIILPL